MARAPLSGARAALLADRQRIERAIDASLLEIGNVRRELAAAESAATPGPAARERVERLRRRELELSAGVNALRARFAERTSRISAAHGGTLPDWWPPRLLCRRCGN